MESIKKKFESNKFLFSELVKRDFKQKYKRTVLGMLWSLISPLLTLLVMALVFTQFFGRDNPHYIIYLFAGNLNYVFFKQATSDGMASLANNANIIIKVKTSKYLFLLSKNVAAFINYLLTLVIFFIFVAVDGLPFTASFIMLLIPIICLLIFNVGIGMILSALYVFFKDIKYLYDIFTLLIMYTSAIFYYVNQYPESLQNLFLMNPIYVYINYFREIVIYGNIPSLAYHGLCVFYAAFALLFGSRIYVKYNYRFIYYM